ncbi:MAG: class GN sortase [Pseudomonadales bacterium]
MMLLLMLIIKVLRKSIIALCLVAGGYLLADGGWIYAKAQLAQQLIEQAWQETLETGKAIKPWPWADTWPVARLVAKEHDVDLYILQGTHGSSLAFGPGYLIGSAEPGGNGSTIVAGHRDTHFRFMKELQQGDKLQLTGRSGEPHSYRVDTLSVVDSSKQELFASSDQSQLLLVTCYPFNSINPGGPLRFVISAVPEEPRRVM